MNFTTTRAREWDLSATSLGEKNNSRNAIGIEMVCSVLSDSLGPHGLPPLSVGFPQQEYWSGLPFLTPGDLPNPRVLCTCRGRGAVYGCATWEAPQTLFLPGYLGK